MDTQAKPKVTVRLDYDRQRPSSPFKPTPTSLSPPLIRPKAKVNSSANIGSRKAPSAVSTTSRSAVNSPRAPSPFKPGPPRIAQTQSLQSAAPTRSHLSARPNTATPDARHRAYTAATPSPAPLRGNERPRRGSASSPVTSSPRSEVSSLSAAAPRPPHPLSEDGPTPNQRVRAKMTKEIGLGSPPTLASPAVPGTRPARVPSISSLSLSPPLMPSKANNSPSPTVTANQASNRFATTRDRPQSYQPQQAYQVFSPLAVDDLAVSYAGYTIAAKVDPTAIPLPPQSPPTSALSFSSHSSVSRSSQSYESQSSNITRSTAPTLHSAVNGHASSRRISQSRGNPHGLGIHSAPDSLETSSEDEGDDNDLDQDDHYGDADRKMKAAAKSIRKIADLEITNRSLLAINVTLEATKHRQAKEIRDLRRKLRESRLILPPVAFRAVKSSLTIDDTAEELDDEDEEDDEDDEETNGLVEGKTDESYHRVKVMIDSLIESCRRALESTPEDHAASGKVGTKVLSAEEVRSWRGDDETRSLLEPDDASHLDVDDSFTISRPLTPSRIAVPMNDSGLHSEDEVEESLFEHDDAPPAPLPPITVTRP